MGLAQHEVETAEVPLPRNNTLTVRGLNMTDMSVLISKHLAEIEAMYQLYSDSRASIFSRRSLDGFIMSVCAKAPDLVAEVISVAADEPEHVGKAKALNFAIQAVALAEIVRLTFEDAGGLKNLSALLQKLLDEAFPESVRAMLRAPISTIQPAPGLQ